MARNKFQAVKDVVPIELHIQKYESDLHAEGNSLIGSHHTHHSKGGRCLHIDLAENRFNCLHAGCDAGGSVIDYEADRLKIDIYAAVESLADAYNIDIPNETPEQRETRRRAYEKRVPVQELMVHAFQLYHANLNRENYFKERGILTEVIASDLLGYAPPGGTWLASRLEKVSDDRESLLGTGLFYQNRDGNLSDRYSDRYIFPYWFRGHPVFSIGRSTDPDIESHKKYVKHLVKSDKYPFVNEQAVRHILWGEDKIRDNAKILMAEGIIDAILARHHFGDTYTVISPVTSQVSKDQMERLALLTTRAESITIVADSEENNAGEKGAIKSGEHIKRKWIAAAADEPDRFRKQAKKNADGKIEAVVVYPPAKIARLRRPPESEKRDLADFITGGHTKELEYWIRSAQPLEYQRQREKGDIKRFFEGKTTFVAKRMTDECLLESNYFLYTAEQLHRYQDGVYAQNGEDFIRDYAKGILGEVWTSTRNQSLIDWLQDPVDSEQVNPDPNILNVENGLLDLQTHEVKPHNPYYLSNVRIPVTYRADAAWEVDSAGEPIINPESGNPKLTTAGKDIQRFITSIVPLDAIDLIYEMSGYCLWAQARYDQGFILIGSGANGKGTLLNLITAMTGKANISNVPAQDLCESRFKSAELFGKLANVCADIPATPIKDSSQIKMITSGDNISAERKHQHPFEFRPFATLLFSANEIPRSRDKTHAFYRRWSFIPFPNRFEGKAKDENLITHLTTPENLSAFLHLSIEGLKRLWEQGSFSSSQSANAIMDEYKVSNDSVAAFISEYVIESPGSQIARQQLYNQYKEYCEGSGYNAVAIRRFNTILQNQLPRAERRDQPRPAHWTGIDLN